MASVRDAYQIQASAASNSRATDSGYSRKLSRMTVLSFGLLRGRSRRESATMEVMEGFWRHCSRTSRPMKPVEPVRMTFIVRMLFVQSRAFSA